MLQILCSLTIKMHNVSYNLYRTNYKHKYKYNLLTYYYQRTLYVIVSSCSFLRNQEETHAFHMFCVNSHILVLLLSMIRMVCSLRLEAFRRPKVYTSDGR